MAAGEKGRAALWHRRAAEWAAMSDPWECVRNWRLVREFAPSVTDAQERPASLGEALDLYRMVGATGHTERLAREIAA
jgi:hypothetical protein